MRILAIGRCRGPEAELFARYAARIRPRLECLEGADGTGSLIEIKRREADFLLGKLAPTDFAIALDQSGPSPGSSGLADQLIRWRETSRRLIFIIGGAAGLDAAVLTRADATLSLGPFTWPHLLVRPMLAEQIYRAQTILAGHPYHRGERS